MTSTAMTMTESIVVQGGGLWQIVTIVASVMAVLISLGGAVFVSGRIVEKVKANRDGIIRNTSYISDVEERAVKQSDEIKAQLVRMEGVQGERHVRIGKTIEDLTKSVIRLDASINGAPPKEPVPDV